MIKNARYIPLILALVSSVFITSCDPPAPKIVKRAAIPNAPAVQGDGVAQLLSFMNQARRAQGKPTLVMNSKLTAASRAHSVSMNQNNFFSHKGLDGSTFRTRLMKQGYRPSFSAENLAKTNHPLRALKLWENSPSHNKNMMQKGFKQVGIARSGNYWTAIFSE